mgnify:CR=1 FL=1
MTMANRRFASIRMAFLLLLMLPIGCGYHNPNALPDEEQGPVVRLYAPLWNNPTSETTLAPRLQTVLHDWLMQHKRINLVHSNEGADYLLTGKILSMRYPGRSYDLRDTARGLKAVLTVEYSITDRRTGQPLIAPTSISLEEPYVLGSNTAQTDSNRKLAQDTLLDELAEQIHVRVSRALSRQPRN